MPWNMVVSTCVPNARKAETQKRGHQLENDPGKNAKPSLTVLKSPCVHARDTSGVTHHTSSQVLLQLSAHQAQKRVRRNSRIMHERGGPR